MIINSYVNRIRSVSQPARLLEDIVANTFINNTEPTPPPVSSYEYPTFSIIGGVLSATYNTDNRKLAFNINESGNLIATYDEEDPKLLIQSKYLYREV